MFSTSVLKLDGIYNPSIMQRVTTLTASLARGERLPGQDSLLQDATTLPKSQRMDDPNLCSLAEPVADLDERQSECGKYRDDPAPTSASSIISLGRASLLDQPYRVNIDNAWLQAVLPD